MSAETAACVHGTHQQAAQLSQRGRAILHCLTEYFAELLRCYFQWEIAAFDRPSTSCFLRSIVTMALSCIISEIKMRYWSKIVIFHISPVSLLGPQRNIAIRFGLEKLECCGYRWLKKVYSLRHTLMRVSVSCLIIPHTRETDTTRRHRPRLCRHRAAKN